MKKISQCRACGSTALTPAFSLDANRVGKSGARRSILGGRKSAPMEYVLCDSTKDAHACGLVQQAYSGALDDIATSPSGTYRTTRSHLRTIATEALELVSGRDCAALDIGCNDGTLLSFYPRWVDRYGVDPDDSVDAIGAWAWTAKAAFPSADIDHAFNEKKFDLITAVSVLEKVEEPRAFLARIKSLLTKDGILALETSYAPMTLTHAGADTFATGAVSLYSLGVLERILRDCELKTFRGALTDKEGGSVRLYITHADTEEYDFDPWYERLARLWDEENALALRAIQPYQAFENRVADARQAYAATLADFVKRGETAHILGDDGRAQMLYAWAGESASCIEAAVGATKGQQNRLCADGPPVISETDCRDAQPDYLIAPASLKREMLERWREPILQGAQMVFATPAPHIVHAGNYAAEFGKSLSGGDGAGGVETLRAILDVAGGPRLIAESGKRASTG